MKNKNTMMALALSASAALALSACSTVTGPDGRKQSYVTPAGQEIIAGLLGTGLGVGAGALIGGGKGAIAGGVGAAAGQVGNLATRALMPKQPTYPPPQAYAQAQQNGGLR